MSSTHGRIRRLVPAAPPHNSAAQVEKARFR
jgi:hypothetical protein